MTGHCHLPFRRLRAGYAAWIETFNPNTIVTLTLNQAARSEGPSGPVWQRGDAITYEGVFKSLVKRISRELYGRKRTDRGARLPCVGVVEGGGVEKAFHIHFVARRPAEVSVDDFRQLLVSVCAANGWVKSDIDVQERTGRFVDYMLKEGFDALLLP